MGPWLQEANFLFGYFTVRQNYGNNHVGRRNIEEKELLQKAKMRPHSRLNPWLGVGQINRKIVYQKALQALNGGKF